MSRSSTKAVARGAVITLALLLAAACGQKSNVKDTSAAPASPDQGVIWLCIWMRKDQSKSGPKYRNRSPATTGFIAHSCPQGAW